MVEVEFDLARHLLTEIGNQKVPGDVVEFGVFEGKWLKVIAEINEAIGLRRTLYGFDSFEGLPPPGDADEGLGWEEGMYEAPLEKVQNYLGTHERPYIKLIKGWFSDTTKLPEAQSIKQIAYARVDGDLYSSAVDTLAFLTGRLSDGSILVFDDWTFHPEKGKRRRFFEWAPTVPYKFEFIGHLGIGRLYLRVRHK